MAEWSKIPVLGITHFACVGVSTTPIILLTFLYKVVFPLFQTPAHSIIYHSMLLTTHNTGSMAKWSWLLV